jgi:hypothetical protein
MREYTVRIDGKVIDTRKSARPYSHAIVCTDERREHGLGILGYSRTADLAMKAARTYSNARYTYGADKGQAVYAGVQVVAVEVREIAKRQRTRCTGLYLAPVTSWYGNGDGIGWTRWMQCKKDATGAGIGTSGPRCAGCATTDNAAIKAEAVRSQEAARVESDRRSGERHAAAYTVETCPAGTQGVGCKVHGIAPRCTCDPRKGISLYCAIHGGR